MIRVGRLRGPRAQVIGDPQREVNQASQDIMTLRLGALIHGLSLHGHIHHGQLIG